MREAPSCRSLLQYGEILQRGLIDLKGRELPDCTAAAGRLRKLSFE